ncbi:MAG: UDP-N-acetylmuramoyl-L-alanyl-D-glutamate--2,6-diaminopimelate ligase [Ruminococcaceae bacterium]|nr:UDP-N-acetylmuramoyl-L-alanyl-D-glutamate--2,6-diaminopimelate ligase [Oscillospiraceae bacterium]
MKLEKLLEGVAVVNATACMDAEITSITDSSREVMDGGLFIAVVGYSTDGHRYIPDAISRGARIVICEKEMPQGTEWVQVQSARTAMAQIAANFYGRPAEKMKMIGITGTNGKTSVTYLLKAVLEKTTGKKVGLIGTICKMIGDEVLHGERTTPGAMELQSVLKQMYDSGCAYVLMEVSSHALAQERTAQIPFEIGAFTNLTQDHLDFHGSMEEYAQAKALLFRQCKNGVFDTDTKYAQTMMHDATCTRMTVGWQKPAELMGKNIVLESDRIEMDVCCDEECHHLRVGIPGRFTVSNCLLVLGIAKQLNLGLQEAVEALSQAKGVKGRIEVVPTPGYDFTVLIDYAHTPDGLQNVLRSVRDFAKARIITVFGCGGDRDNTKRPTMGKDAAELSDLVIVTSDNPRTEDPMKIIGDILGGMKNTNTPYIVEENRRKAIRLALRLAEKDDMIVLAGKGHETYQILGTEKTHLDEREEVAEALCEMQSH